MWNTERRCTPAAAGFGVSGAEPSVFLYYSDFCVFNFVIVSCARGCGLLRYTYTAVFARLLVDL